MYPRSANTSTAKARSRLFEPSETDRAEQQPSVIIDQHMRSWNNLSRRKDVRVFCTLLYLDPANVSCFPLADNKLPIDHIGEPRGADASSKA
jgi:hypothetical protein